MLPFLQEKKKSIADVIVAERKPDTEEPKDSEENHGLLSAAQDLIDAIHSKDAKAVSAALRAHDELADSEPEESEEE